jgi:hypothetical protein
MVCFPVPKDGRSPFRERNIEADSEGKEFFDAITWLWALSLYRCIPNVAWVMSEGLKYDCNFPTAFSAARTGRSLRSKYLRFSLFAAVARKIGSDWGRSSLP